MEPTEILHKYWGYNAFRPGQQEVVNDVLHGKEVLALFPTGGGKSICFQVPGLMLEGCTLVVSPLVSLMKDQTDALKKRNIGAVHLHSGLAKGELRILLENAMKGRYKFLYVAPERLLSADFREYLPALNIQLLVVDEAHCISQWGHDFRPSYLRIHEIKELIPQAKIAAFTASASVKVQEDIIRHLNYKKPVVHKADFNRPNLVFYATQTENKSGYVLKALTRSEGSAIVFCDTRRETEEMARFLYEYQLSCDFYHAGLPADVRAKKQELWMKGQTRIMVCTNAFGMGVDKPDVRLVIHQAPPQSPEAYYQEAGRAGRDGNKSWCILLHHAGDIDKIKEQIIQSFPDMQDLKRAYHAVHNYYNIADGGGAGLHYEFDLKAIADRYKMPQLLLLNCLKNIEILGFWSLADSVFAPSRIYFKWPYENVYELKIKKPEFEYLLDVILRTYGGVFDRYEKISEYAIAKRLKKSPEDITRLLKTLAALGVIDYLPITDKPIIQFIEPRNANPVFSIKQLQPLRNSKLEGLNIMDQYIHENRCRSAFWQLYFGGTHAKDCGVCDCCQKRLKVALTGKDRPFMEAQLRQIIGPKGKNRTEVLQELPENYAFELRELLRELMDNRAILIDANGLLYWK